MCACVYACVYVCVEKQCTTKLVQGCVCVCVCVCVCAPLDSGVRCFWILPANFDFIDSTDVMSFSRSVLAAIAAAYFSRVFHDEHTRVG